MEMTQSTVVAMPLGQPALSALQNTLREVQGDDPFCRVVVVADHPDVASSVRHFLGASNVLNVTAQTGDRLAAELARPLLRPARDDTAPPRRALNRLHESRAVRQVADRWLESSGLSLSPAGRRRLYGELTTALRQWEQQHDLDDADTPPGVGAASLDLPELYADFRALLNREGYYTGFDLPRLAAQALPNHWSEGTEPAVIYYLPRHPTAGELEMMQALLERGKCRVIIGLTGDTDANADGPAKDLYHHLTDADAPTDAVMPLQRAVDDGVLSVTVAPDPVEEVRAAVRRIIAIADDVPFHRIAVIHRQDAPYASLIRQELDFAGIPSSGLPRRTLADTGAGRFLLGALALATAMDGDADTDPAIDREQFIDLIMSCPVWFPPSENASQRRREYEIPAIQWADLARAARASGTVREWETRLAHYIKQQSDRMRERDGDVPAEQAAGTGRLDADALIAFLDRLAPRLLQLRRPSDPDWDWQSAADLLKSLLANYLKRTDGDEEDYRRITDILDRLTGLSGWDAEYDAGDLRETIGDELHSPVSDRGRPIGSGVYVGPPAGIAGAQYGIRQERYGMVFAVGMAEGQFPPSQRVSIVDEWRDSGAAAQTRRELERYEFLGAVASADRVALSYPVAGANQRMAYPSPWLLEAANLLHHASDDTAGRLTAENLATDVDNKPWLTVIPSRERGLRRLADAGAEATVEAAPADLDDYNLMHLLGNAGRSLASHPAWATVPRVLKALEAWDARMSNALTEWDGGVGPASLRITDTGTPDRAVSASALETWATCPYRYFLKYVLRVSAPPSAEDADEISALDRGSLVHRILEKFVKQELKKEEELIALADAEFDAAGSTGIAGYPLLWEMEKETIRAGLRRFFIADATWLGEVLKKSRAEETFDNVPMEDVPELGTVHFRGKIDRLDVLADGEVRVRDFKTGSPDHYTSGLKAQNAYTVGNGRALQLPVYVAAARQMDHTDDITASYCFPLSDNPTREARKYPEEEGLVEFHKTLRNILIPVRSGVFPATPDDANRGNCYYCDFNRLCPVRKRQIWERKGRHDSRVQPFNDLNGPAAIKDQ